MTIQLMVYPTSNIHCVSLSLRVSVCVCVGGGGEGRGACVIVTRSF